MNRTERMDLMRNIQTVRGSKIIVYVTGDRMGLETKIGTDAFPIFHKHLISMGEQERIDLFVYSTGGITIVGYGLVILLREFCKEFNMIIPFKALSAATLMALGANEIVMTRMGQLSPIDPSITHPLGPLVKMPGQPEGRLAPLNVEDVNAFIDLAKEELGLTDEESMLKVLELLASRVDPLALGAVHRARQQIGFLASVLMAFHTQDSEHINKCVETLTRQRFSHNYIIGRREAKEALELNIIEPDEYLTGLVVGLFDAYNDIIMMDKPYHPEAVLGEDETKTVSLDAAIIESLDSTYVFRDKREVKRVMIGPPAVPHPTVMYQQRTLQQQWIEDNSI